MLSRLQQLLRTVAAEIGLREVFVFGGLGLTVHGVAQIYPPAAWIVAGVVLFTLGVRRG